MQYKRFTLDKFQEDSINSFLNNNSVVVSAATGTGKTLIADYIIDTEIKRNKRVIYTAPIKALSNQKFSQFRKEYGKDKIGIMTGDVVINPEAPVLIMTTEIYRNMLMTKDHSIADVSYLIFDEIHFISDIERGTVWEESIIFSPDNVRFLCLSATIPNADEFAEWISKIKNHKVDVVKYNKRAVPLHHYLFDHDIGLTDITGLKEQLKLDKHPSYEYISGRSRRRKPRLTPPNHLELIEELSSKNLTPCIYFVFSRAATEKKTKELAKSMNFLSKKESRIVAEFISNEITKSSNSSEIRRLNTTILLNRTLQKGIAFHHAGVLPKLKEIVEKLFEQGLVHVLYATETFAVGINMPAKVVCFESLEKFDGRTFRYLHSQEYFQLAGRAGRRGIDKEGKAIALVDRRFANPEKIKNITTNDKDPIESQFKLSFNSTLNMIKNHSDEEIEIILKSNFGCFQKKGKAIALTKASFNKKKKILSKMHVNTPNTIDFK